ncbi:MAG: cupin domain-containing protein [Candidatus Bathyarchaeia archaeon]
MIVRPADVPERKAFTVRFKTLATGANIMCTVMYYEKGDVVPFHKHASEQVGYVVEGKLRLKIESEDLGIISTGDSYLVRGNMLHSLEALEKSVVVDMFSPPREEYKNK